MERISWEGLKPHERKELEGVLRDPGRFLSDYGDSAAWWLMLLIAGTAGAVASGMQFLPWLPQMSLAGLLSSFRALLFPLGFVASLAIVVGTTFLWIGNHRRRGFAATSFATIRVKGPRLALVRHADLAGIEWTRHAPPRRQRFSVLILTGTDGKRLTLYVHAGWVRTAIAQIDQSRAAAGLPPIAGDARRVPE